MSNILKISKYYTANIFKLFIIIVAATLLVHIAASILVDTTLGPEREAGLIAPLVLVGGFAVGTLVFPASFRYLSSQGISRRDYMVSTGINLLVIAAATALLVTVYQAVIFCVADIRGAITIYESMYHNQNLFSMFVWEFAVLFFLSVFGWLDRVVAYRGKTKVMLILYSIPVIAWITLSIVNSTTGGAFVNSLIQLFAKMLGIYNGELNPYAAVLSFIMLAVILLGTIYLLLRRAQVTD